MAFQSAYPGAFRHSPFSYSSIRRTCNQEIAFGRKRQGECRTTFFYHTAWRFLVEMPYPYLTSSGAGSQKLTIWRKSNGVHGQGAAQKTSHAGVLRSVRFQEL